MKIAMLLDGAISNDHRVIKMIQTISKSHEVDLFCLEDEKSIAQLNFNKQVRVFKTKHKMNLRTKVLRHSFFCFEHTHFYQKVMDANVSYDAVWANDLPTLFPASVCAKKLNAKLIYDSHEIYVETINQFFPTKASFPKSSVFKWLKSIMTSHGKRMEKKLIQKCDHFITVNDSLMDWFQNEYEVKNGLVVMNMPRLNMTELIPFDFNNHFGFNENDKVLLYQGNLNQGRGLEFLAKMTHTLPQGFKLVFIGDGPLKKLLQSICLEKNVGFLDTVSINKLPHYTAGGDIGINFLEPLNLSKKMASPNKLFEYIHAYLPILATEGLENRRIIDEFNVGVLCELTESSFLMALEKFNVHSSKTFIENCKMAKDRLKWGNQEADILSLFDEKTSLSEKN